MANSFIGRFIASVSAQRKNSYMEIVRQRKDETLRGYVAHFDAKALQILNLDESRVVEAIQKETTSTDFFGSLSRKPPTTLANLMQQAEKYIR